MSGPSDNHRPPGWVFVLPWAPDGPGGVNTVVRALRDEFNTSGEVRPILFRNLLSHFRLEEGKAPDWAVTFSMGITRVIPGTRPIRWLLSLARWPIKLFDLSRAFARRDVRVVNAHFPDMVCVFIIAMRKLGLWNGRLVLSFHGADIEYAAQTTGQLRKAWNLIVTKADAVTACSDALARRVESVFALPAGQVHTTHNGVNTSQLLASADEYPAELDDFPCDEWLLNVATYEPKKGQDVLLRAFADIAGRRPGLGLVIVGRSDQSYESLQQQVEDLGLEQRVRLLKDIPPQRMGGFFNNCRMFVLPSRIEPFGIVLLEAAVFAKPVVASRVGGIPEIIEHGRNGLLFEVDEMTQLRDRMVELLESPEKSLACGQAFQQDLQTRFSWRETAKAYLKIGGLIR